ncbi:MAG TPA: DNA polymerase IV [Terriglobales bacterium]|nr:DNA polymerase IV [Terriglobales bacterium]
MGIRKIIHVDMDAFYASVEQRDHPRLLGKPVIVAWKGKRSVVCAASYEARRFGVHSAMPAIQAQRVCPEAVMVPPDFTRYRAVSRAVRGILKRHTDLIEPLSLDEAYLDVTENKTGLATATLVARTIREQIRQELKLTASAGVASNKFLAKLASDWRKPDGLFVIQPEQIEAFLLPLPVGRLPGVGKVTEEKLALLGIKTVRELRGLELPALENLFGKYGVRLYELARGIDDHPVLPDRATQSISVEDTFDDDVPLSETESMIRSLAEKLWLVSRKEPRVARTVVLKLKTSEFKLLTRSYTPVAPPSSCEELTEIALKLRARVHLGARQRYRLVGVGLSNFREPAKPGTQPGLFP